jgi:hypothetical protein
MAFDLSSIIGTTFADSVGKIISLFKLDPNVAAQHAADLEKLQTDFQTTILTAYSAQDTAQADIDKVEAGSTSWIAANWRPLIGLVCGSAFAYTFVIQPFLQFLLVAFHVNFDVNLLPKLDMSSLNDVLLGLLGLGGLHAWENVTATKTNSKSS